MFLRENLQTGKKFAVVKEGVLLRSNVPTIPLLQAIDRRYQIKTIVALLNDEEMKHPAFEVEKNFTRQHGIQFIVLRMGTPLPEQVTEFLKIVNTPTNQPVLVHRWHGTVRTGALVAIYRVKEEG